LCIDACTKPTVFTGNRNNIEVFLHNRRALSTLLSPQLFRTPPPTGRGAKYCNENVRFAVFLSVRARMTRKPHGRTSQDFCACCRGSVLLWHGCDMLCTSGFVDDVMCVFTYWPYCARRVYSEAAQNTTSTKAEIPTRFCSEIKTSKYSSSLEHRGRSLLSAIALLLFSVSHVLLSFCPSISCYANHSRSVSQRS